MPDKKQKTKLTGDQGEKKAAENLHTHGYTIVERNWRIRTGEIDIIAEKDDTLVFAEVKTVPHSTLETLEHVLGKIKQKRIVETAKCFLQTHRQYSNRYLRFDVLVIDMPCYAPVYHIENAFSELL